MHGIDGLSRRQLSRHKLAVLHGAFSPQRAMRYSSLHDARGCRHAEGNLRYLKPSEVQKWVNEAFSGMENALSFIPRNILELYNKRIGELTSAYGEPIPELKARKKLNCQQGLNED